MLLVLTNKHVQNPALSIPQRGNNMPSWLFRLISDGQLKHEETCLEHIVMIGRGSDRRDTSNLIATGPALN